MNRLRLCLYWDFLRKTYLHLFKIFLILIVGCAHSRHIPQHSRTNELEQINEKVAEKNVKLVLMSSPQKLAAQNVQVSFDSVYYTDPESNMKLSIATSEVNQIIRTNRVRGLAEGFGFGLLAGGTILGVATLAAIGEDNDDEALEIFYGGAQIGRGVLLLGTFMGAVIGSKNIYVLNEKENVSSKPADTPLKMKSIYIKRDRFKKETGRELCHTPLKLL